MARQGWCDGAGRGGSRLPPIQNSGVVATPVRRRSGDLLELPTTLTSPVSTPHLATLSVKRCSPNGQREGGGLAPPGRTQTPNLGIRSPHPTAMLPGVFGGYSDVCVTPASRPFWSVSPVNGFGLESRYATAHPEKTRRERHLWSLRTFQRDRLTPSDAGSSVRHCSERTVMANYGDSDNTCQRNSYGSPHDVAGGTARPARRPT